MSGYAQAAIITFDPGNPSFNLNGPTLNTTPGTVAIGEVASYVSGSNGFYGVATCYPAGLACDPGPTPASAAAAASAIDHYWIQGDPAITFGFSRSYSSIVAVAGLDHGPVPEESLEFIVWGSVDGVTLSEQGAIRAVYDLGVDGGSGPLISGSGGDMGLAESDDFSSVWVFNSSYSRFIVTSGDHIANFASPGEFEIDGLAAPAPEPSSMLLFAMGLIGLASARRRR